MLIPLILVTAAMLDQSAEPPAATRALPPASSSAWSASDEEINRSLLEAYRRDPSRRVCATYTQSGESIPRSVCGTLQSFFAMRTRAEVAQNRAPYRLIEEIKRRRDEARRGT